MKKTIFSIFVMMFAFFLLSNSGCDSKKIKSTSDTDIQKQTEVLMQEANRQVGMPAIVNYQEKKNLKWIYELCDQSDYICHAYLFNSFTGEIGQYLGKCIGYGIPYSTQFSNPEKYGEVDGGEYGAINPFLMPQPEPNGLFKPEGLSATWLIMIHPETSEPTPVYVEPEIIVSPFKFK